MLKKLGLFPEKPAGGHLDTTTSPVLMRKHPIIDLRRYQVYEKKTRQSKCKNCQNGWISQRTGIISQDLKMWSVFRNGTKTILVTGSGQSPQKSHP
jgi:cytochrome c-type biogenesis protein CcmH/NrfF